MKRVIHAACPHDCPDACGVLITIEDGRATKIQGDPAHPVTRGFLCAKVAKYLDRVYSPDRVLYPMKRMAPKGTSGKQAWQRITWDEALDVITSKLRAISEEHGTEAVLPYSYGGTLGALNHGAMDRRFFHRLGASQLDRTICSSAGGDALISLTGWKLGTEPEQFRHSKYIIAWGANIHGNNVHLWPFIEEARRDGAKFVVIDPYRTRTAKCADWYIAINPGTDGALAMAMMHVIIRDRLYDADYVAQHTIGFDELCDRVHDFTPEVASRYTGIPVSDIETLAREYATMRPAAIRVNYGIQRADNGGMAIRAVAMLPTITGSWKEVGGGLQLSTSGAFKLNRAALERTDLMLASPLKGIARTLNMTELGRVLHDVNDPPVQALFVYGSNPAAVCPDHNRVIDGLKRPDLFTVVHEQFFTDTTDYADYVLPATTFFEHKELQAAYGHYWLQVSDQAIAPLGECKSNVDLFRELALHMGFDEPCFRESIDTMIDAALDTPHPFLKGVDRARLEREGHVRLNFKGNGSDSTEPYLPFSKGEFPTPSGKAELYSESLKHQGLDPVIQFLPNPESRHNPDSRYPLELLARKADNYLNSTFANLSVTQQMESPGLIELHATDASSRGISDGDLVRVFNSRGELRLHAHVNGAVQHGVVAARLNWAKLTDGGKNINVLTSQRLTDIGRGATFYATLVEVEKVRQ